VGIFDGREKALEATIASLRSELADVERSNHVLARTAKESSDQVTELRKIIKRDKETIAELEQRLNDRADLPEANLTAIRIFVQGLGAAMLLVSMLFGGHLALAKEYKEYNQLIWFLYCFTQFLGMYLLGFGTRTTLRSLSLLGSYMSTLTVISVVAIGLSLMQYVNILAVDHVVVLGAVNAIGIPLLIYVERRRAVPALFKS
jgi:hypothetical protein